MSLLEVEGLTKRFGGLTAVDEVTFTVEERRIFSIIGPNGAGKSTLFKLVTAFLRPTAGRVRLAGEDITGRSPHAVARRGVVRTFQETTIFREMTALDNVVVAHHLQGDATLAGFFFGSRRARASEPRSGRARGRSSTTSGSGRSRARPPATCPTAICAPSGSRSRWPRTPASCSSTSPSRA